MLLQQAHTAPRASHLAAVWASHSAAAWDTNPKSLALDSPCKAHARARRADAQPVGCWGSVSSSPSSVCARAPGPADAQPARRDAAYSTTMSVPALPLPLPSRRSPLTIRKDCSAARAHQVFINLGLRHLLVVDAHTRVVGIITRKDLDHAAGHGWWRMSHVAEPPKNKFVQQLRAIGSVGFLARLLGERRSVSRSLLGGYGSSCGLGCGQLLLRAMTVL